MLVRTIQYAVTAPSPVEGALRQAHDQALSALMIRFGTFSLPLLRQVKPSSGRCPKNAASSPVVPALCHERAVRFERSASQNRKGIAAGW
ncbi:hypothetical protein JZ751_018425 [Albula glossodonta]|uniref:Uncharacterized protein n=1 Tax=Albula glossodonta TaxID=121402 RepID=A0A8T2N1W1_9TELE|nr:hypothetical protein JZ751_018425 [Albula glossodonta]